MLRATAHQLLPTTITGSLPRPSWYTENLGLKSFLQALVETRFREQYEDALAVYFNEQAIAGLDIVTDGDARFTQDIGGQSWTSYPPFHMAGFDGVPKMAPVGGGGIGFPRGHILHDYIEARLMPSIVGPIGRGNMQYAQMWKAAQRMTDRPVKFGTVTPCSKWNAPSANSASVGVSAFRPNLPTRPSKNRFTRPEMPSPSASSGSARARIEDSGTASSSPKPNTSGVVRFPRAASGGIGSASIPSAALSAGVTES